VGLLFLIAFAAGGAIANSPAVLKSAAAPSPAPVTFKMTHLEGKPLFVRIVYLDQPALEIPVPPLPVHSTEASAPDPAEPQVVVITNTTDGVQGVAIQP
jgi:hypothetical protein